MNEFHEQKGLEPGVGHVHSSQDKVAAVLRKTGLPTGMMRVGWASSSFPLSHRKSWYRLLTSNSLESNSPRDVCRRKQQTSNATMRGRATPRPVQTPGLRGPHCAAAVHGAGEGSQLPAWPAGKQTPRPGSRPTRGVCVRGPSAPHRRGPPRASASRTEA